MALAGGGAPEHLTSRRLLNAAYALHLEKLRMMTTWDPSALPELLEEFEAELVAPLPQARRALAVVVDEDAVAAARLRERLAAVQAMGGEVG